MSDRVLASLGALATVSAVVALAPVSVWGQTSAGGAKAAQTAATKTWTPPRTSGGQPDLQGIWVNNGATPLERPKALEGKQFLTDDEVAELRKRADRLFKGGKSDIAGGDTPFLATLANPEVYKSPNGATGTSDEMIDRVFACHEGNYDIMRGVLAGARAEERAAEDALKSGAK